MALKTTVTSTSIENNRRINGREWLEHRGSVGRVDPTLFKVVRDDGSDAPAGEVGEVFMRSSADGTARTYRYVGAEARTLPGGWESLGDMGHLSNRQAAELTATVAGRSGEGFPCHLVQLHVSRECNKPELAAVAGRAWRRRAVLDWRGPRVGAIPPTAATTDTLRDAATELIKGLAGDE